MPARYPVFKPLKDGWRRGVIVMRVPHGVDRMMLHLSPKHKEAGEKTLFGNVFICRLDD